VSGLAGRAAGTQLRAVELGARAALALGLNINHRSIFSRKNYFYPDLRRVIRFAYDQPFSARGVWNYDADRDEAGHAHDWHPLTVNVTRLHLERTGKNVHEGLPDVDRYSYIDLNRAGTPLAEIVTEPDFRTSWQAYDYVNTVRRALQWVGASEADMEKGTCAAKRTCLCAHRRHHLRHKVELKKPEFSSGSCNAQLSLKSMAHQDFGIGGRLVSGDALWG